MDSANNTIHINPSFIAKNKPKIHFNPSFVNPLLKTFVPSPSSIVGNMSDSSLLQSIDSQSRNYVVPLDVENCKTTLDLNKKSEYLSKKYFIKYRYQHLQPDLLSASASEALINESVSGFCKEHIPVSLKSDKKYYSSAYLKSIQGKFLQPKSEFAIKTSSPKSEYSYLSSSYYTTTICNSGRPALPNTNCNPDLIKPESLSKNKLYSLDYRRRPWSATEKILEIRNQNTGSLKNILQATGVYKKPLKPTNHSENGYVNRTQKLVSSSDKYSFISRNCSSTLPLQDTRKRVHIPVPVSSNTCNKNQLPSSKATLRTGIINNNKNSKFSKVNYLPLNTNTHSTVPHSPLMYQTRKEPSMNSFKFLRNKVPSRSHLKLIRNSKDDGKKNVCLVKTKTKLIKRITIRRNSKYKKQNLSPSSSILRRSVTYKREIQMKAKENINCKRYYAVPHSRCRIFKGKNKFKLVNKPKDAALISKYKLSRTPESKRNKFLYQLKNSSVTKVRSHKKSDKFINIEGNLYKSTRTSLKKQDLSSKSSANRSQEGLSKTRDPKSFNRISKYGYGRQSTISLQSGTLIEIVRRKKLSHFTRVNDYCFFYNKYGKCKKQNKGCPFKHDPEKIAICTRFLKGVSCDETKCSFSHVLDRNKMPVCSHFLEEGSCRRDPCPYRHVRVNPQAPVCKNFLKGHCPQGEECKKKHILICDEFKATGVCPRGKFCLLSHRKPLKVAASKKLRRSSSLSSRNKIKKKRRSSGKIGVLGLFGSNPPVVALKPHASSSSTRYFESKDDALSTSLCNNPSTSSSNNASTTSSNNTSTSSSNNASTSSSNNPSASSCNNPSTSSSNNPSASSCNNPSTSSSNNASTSSSNNESTNSCNNPFTSSSNNSKVDSAEPDADIIIIEVGSASSFSDDKIFESEFVEKRNRILQKIETLKKLYTVGLDGDSKPTQTSLSDKIHSTNKAFVAKDKSSCDSEASCRSQIEPIVHEQSEHLKTPKNLNPSRLEFRINRFPLPPVLPDFIPLTTTKDDE